MFVQLDDTGRILAAVEDKAYTDESYIEFDFPDDFDVLTIDEYVISDGELIHSPREKTLAEQAAEALQNLQATDYVAAKLAECIATGEDTAPLVVKYDDVLEKRKEWRSIVDRWKSGEVS